MTTARTARDAETGNGATSEGDAALAVRGVDEVVRTDGECQRLLWSPMSWPWTMLCLWEGDPERAHGRHARGVDCLLYPIVGASSGMQRVYRARLTRLLAPWLWLRCSHTSEAHTHTLVSSRRSPTPTAAAASLSQPASQPGHPLVAEAGLNLRMRLAALLHVDGPDRYIVALIRWPAPWPVSSKPRPGVGALSLVQRSTARQRRLSIAGVPLVAHSHIANTLVSCRLSIVMSRRAGRQHRSSDSGLARRSWPSVPSNAPDGSV